MEIWKDILDFDNYQVSSYGNIRSKTRMIWNGVSHFKKEGKELIKTINRFGYNTCCLSKNNKGFGVLIHRIVAQQFILNPEKKATVNHIDSNKLNNNIDNLEWNTISENMKHSFESGQRKHLQKKVIQKSKGGEILNIFDSIRIAERQTGVCNTQISSCMKNKRKTAGGYIWSA